MAVSLQQMVFKRYCDGSIARNIGGGVYEPCAPTELEQAAMAMLDAAAMDKHGDADIEGVGALRSMPGFSYYWIDRHNFEKEIKHVGSDRAVG